MSARLRRVAGGLLVACAGLFVVGVTTEHGSPTETGRPNEETAAIHGEGDEGDEGTSSAAEHVETADEERLLGVDVESRWAAAFAVAVSLVVAVGLWVGKQRWVALVAVCVAIVFAVFDGAEVGRQLDASRTALAALALVVAAGHLTAAGTAGLSTRRRGDGPDRWST